MKCGVESLSRQPLHVPRAGYHGRPHRVAVIASVPEHDRVAGDDPFGMQDSAIRVVVHGVRLQPEPLRRRANVTAATAAAIAVAAAAVLTWSGGGGGTETTPRSSAIAGCAT